ncbi:amidohydrolase family protein [Marinomonas transparens]|uniref:Amidohydrolase family protein n=1 Tax=Marinomonas transparens TaxID=2795388 RepID=A0A934JP21_9GAMM|nr:amidohydrolase family protein [Marinomonas transparens]MBJ7537494.1 amidohydrolase family protein [Marinomonas transparens]
MPQYLIRKAQAVFGYSSTQDIRFKNGVITDIGESLTVHADDVQIDASNCVLYPGFINTHHHLAQSILKGIPAGLNQGLGEWLVSVPYRFWPHITPDLMYVAAKLGLYEQLRSGVTTCADHHYLYHSTTSPELEDAVWRAADDLGIKLVLCRGGATTQGSHKGMQGSKIVPETLSLSLDRLDASYKHYHDDSPFSMRRLVVAPTSLIHTSPAEDLKVYAQWAKDRQLKRHSHLLEVSFDEEMAQQRFGMGAIDYAAHCDWLGEDVWFAHLVKADHNAIKLLAQTKTRIAHCPTSNCRLGSGVAPAIAMEKTGIPITVGVDGSASSESASMLQELNLAWLLHRSQGGPEATNVNQIIHWGTSNGADLLGLITGRIEVGYAADLVLYSLDAPRFAGVHSPLEAPILCGEPALIKHSFINGKQVVENGNVLGVDGDELVQEVRSAVLTLLEREASF